MAQSNYNFNNYLTAYNCFVQAANMGNTFAMMKLASFYEKGDCGLDININESLNWYIKASDAGNFDATFHIGLRSIVGSVDEIDYDKAFEFFMLSIEQEKPGIDVVTKEKICVEKIYNYALKLEGENYDTLDFKTKKTLFNIYYLLADKGVAEAQLKVGIAYLEGLVVKKNDKTALVWLMESAKQGVARAENYVGRFYLEGWGVVKDVSIAISWLEKSCQHGYGPAYNNLGNIYADGNGVDVDYSKAQYYYEKAVELDSAMGYYNLGDIYGYGRNGITDLVKAFELFKYGADILDSAQCQNRVGTAYNLARGVEKNQNLAFSYWQKAVNNDKKYFPANFNMAIAYYRGIGTEINYDRALEYIGVCDKLNPNSLKVQELKEDIKRAKINASYSQTSYEPNTQEVVICCPNCGSSAVHKISVVNKVAKVALFGVLSIGSISKTFKCDTCGYKW